MSRYLILLGFLATGLTLGCASTQEETPAGGGGAEAAGDGKADIYGEDDRRELFDAAEVYRRAAESTAVVTTNTPYYIEDGEIWLKNQTYTRKIASTEGAPLCEGERFKAQPAPGYCSAFLIAPQLMVTAGHCVNLKQRCEDIRFVFGFGYQSSVDEADVRHVPREDFYRCQRVIGHLYDRDAATVEDLINHDLWSDWAVVMLDRPVEGRAPLPINREGRVSVGQQIVAIGHPSGLPTKVTAGHVTESSHDLYFNTDLDIYGGNSGSVAVNTRGEVEGIVIRGTGGKSFHREGDCTASDRCAAYDSRTGSGCTGNHVMRIAPVIQFTEAEGMFASSNDEEVIIPDGSGAAESSVIFSDERPIRFVTLSAQVNHWRPKDLIVSLRREGGASAILFERSGMQVSGGPIFSRTTNAFNGQPAAGRWTLRIEDTAAEPGLTQKIRGFELIIGVGEGYTPSPAATFIGSPCQVDADCDFGGAPRCYLYSQEAGYCTIPCEGYCPDRAGFAPTFCAPLDEGVGICAPKADDLNDWCEAYPSARMRLTPRFIGDSGAAAKEAEVCLP